MTNWKTYKLGEVAEFINGRAYANDEFKEVGTPIVRIQNLTGEGKTVYSDLELPPDKLIESGDLIYAWSATFGPYIWKGPKSIYHYHIWKIATVKNLADKHFLFYKLKFISDELKSQGTGSIFTHITKSLIENFETKLPELQEQKRISSILSSLDSKIELNLLMNQTLEGIAQTIFKEWFINFKFPGFSGKLVDDLPKGWKVGSLRDICSSFKKSYNPKLEEGDMPYVGLEHIPRKSTSLWDWGHSSEINSQKAIFDKGDVLFGKLRPYFHKVVIAPIQGICSTDILVLRSNERFMQVYSLMQLSSDDCIEYANSHSDGTRMPRVNWDSLSKYPVVIPSEQVLKYFQETMTPLIEKMYCNIFENQTLALLRDNLLPRLLTGKIEVKK